MYKYPVIFSRVIKSKTAASRFEYQFILIHLPNDLLSYIVVMKLYKNRIDRIVFTFYEFSSRSTTQNFKVIAAAANGIYMQARVNVII